MTNNNHRSVGPDKALNLLRAGNKRFMAGRMTPRDQFPERRMELTSGQAPYASILCCSDSRVPPELIFDEGLGRLFIARVAGNVLTQELLASLEYAALHSTSRLIVVLGHEYCGAVTSAVHTLKQNAAVDSPHLQCLLDHIFPIVKDMRAGTSLEGQPFIELCSEENARRTATRVVAESAALKDLVSKGEVRVVPAMYALADGKVTFLAE
jgi:carbonic anhydrase